jgi:hypothetical protein
MRFAHGVLWKWLPPRRSDATSIFLVLIALLPWVSAQPPPPGPHEESGDGDEVSHDGHHDHGRGGASFLEEWLGGDFASFSF